MMTNTTTRSHEATSERVRPTTLQAVTMVAGPAVLLAGFVLHPSDEGNSATVLRRISEHHSEWVSAHVLLFAAAALLIPAVLALGRLVAGPQRRASAAASALVVFASVGLAGAAAFEQLLGVAATLDGDAAAMARLLDGANDSVAVTGMLYLPQLAVVLGFLIMAWALFRSKTVPTWSAVAMAVGAVGVLAPEPGRCIATGLLLTTFVVALRRSLRAGVVEPHEEAATPRAPATGASPRQL